MQVQSFVMMISFSSIHFVQAALLLIHIYSAVAELSEDFCDRATYGQPNYSTCIALLYGNPTHGGTGIYNIDSDEHGFLLPYFGHGADFTISQWRHRVRLPEVWHNGTPRCPSQLFVGKLYLADILYVDGCKIALLVKPGPMGGFTTDSGSWAEIADRGKALLDYCLLGRRAPAIWGGGVGHAGTHGRLNIVIYQRGSVFDRAIAGGIGPGGLVGVDWNETTANLSASGRIGILSHA